ncbi:MAG: GFA family protein [Alphaproteobacteria bacterium]|jgi:hypothetical protein|nr:GFA family protein [Alphaproteobacteria bacterium]
MVDVADKEVLTGGCQCGAVRYEVVAKPLALWVCHCRECQRQSASAFGISVIVRSSDVRLVAGELKTWSRPAAKQGTLECSFCPDCGTRVWHGDRDVDDAISIKGGSLDEPVDLGAATHIWTSRKLAGVVIPDGVPRYAEEPE